MSEESVQCSQCGSAVQTGSGFCASCGTKLAGSPVPPPTSPFAGWGSSARAKEALMLTIGRRQQTDVKLSEYWILLPVAVVVASYVLGLVGFMYDVLLGFLVIVIGGIVGVILLAFLVYILLKRRNEHMAREAQMRRELMDYFRFRGQEMGISHRTEPYVQAMQAFDRGSLMHEEPQSALLWTILCLIPGINIVAIVLTLFWLTDYAPGHDRRFYGFSQNAHYAAEQVGMGPLLSGAWKSITERSFILYLILSILLPVFAIWWFYVLIKDLNDHFDNEWMFEENLMAELRKTE